MNAKTALSTATCLACVILSCGERPATSLSARQATSHAAPNTGGAKVERAFLDPCCGGPSCPSWKEAERAIRRFAAEEDCLQAFVGRCGALRVVRKSDGFTSEVFFFDDAGGVIAAGLFSDAGPPVICGEQPSCDRPEGEELCGGKRRGKGE